MCFGTPQYMAPELIQGKPYDKSIDLYALGVIAFEMFSGVLPWDGADPRQVLISVCKKPPPHLTAAQHPSITRIDELDAFVQRALSKETKRRPASAEIFFKEFELALFGKAQQPRANVPAAEAAFASIWQLSLDLRKGDDATEIDGNMARVRTPVELLPVDSASASGIRKRRLHSGWLKSIESAETLDDEAITDENLKKAAQEVMAQQPPTPPPAKAPIPRTKSKDTYYAPHTEATRSLKDPSAQKRIILWLIPLLVGLVVFAAALGYFLGRQSGR
jgi:serine/threonine protein kinase